MSATQAENARLRQELELVNATNCSIRLEQALAELKLTNLAQRVQLKSYGPGD